MSNSRSLRYSSNQLLPWNRSFDCFCPVPYISSSIFFGSLFVTFFSITAQKFWEIYFCIYLGKKCPKIVLLKCLFFFYLIVPEIVENKNSSNSCLPIANPVSGIDLFVKLWPIKLLVIFGSKNVNTQRITLDEGGCLLNNDPS